VRFRFGGVTESFFPPCVSTYNLNQWVRHRHVTRSFRHGDTLTPLLVLRPPPLQQRLGLFRIIIFVLNSSL